MTFGELLKRHREHVGLSQSMLALIAEMDKSHISRLEAGERNPTRETVKLLARAMALTDVETDELLAAAGFTSANQDPLLIEVRNVIQETGGREAVSSFIGLIKSMKLAGNAV